jgi:hypothetical protein
MGGHPNLTYDRVEGRWKVLQASGLYERRAYLLAGMVATARLAATALAARLILVSGAYEPCSIPLVLVGAPPLLEGFRRVLPVWQGRCGANGWVSSSR